MQHDGMKRKVETITKNEAQVFRRDRWGQMKKVIKQIAHQTVLYFPLAKPEFEKQTTPFNFIGRKMCYE